MTPADPSDTLRLAWLVDEHWGKAYPIGDRVTIGRGPENRIILRDAAVSRLHAEVRRAADHFELRALGASGMNLNGAPAAPSQELNDGDLIEIAFSLLRFQLTPPAADLLVVTHDTPTYVDAKEAPTAAFMRAARQSTAFESFTSSWQWLRRRLTRGPKTD